MTTAPKPGGPLLSLRTFILVVVALVAAVGAGACAYWHMPWILVGAAAFAGTLTFLQKIVE
jgi:hypothetical protein